MKNDSISSDDPELKELCKYSFDTLLKYLDKSSNINPKFPEKFKGKSFPLFVTWKIGEEKELRGCIGTFESSDLEKNLKDYSLIAAFQDPRFDPIELKEFKYLNCGISLLVNFEEVNNIYDWEIGKHGIQIQFDNGRHYGATYLPQVAFEQGWNQKETLESLIMKAGFYGSLNEVEKLIKLTRYESIKVEMSYEEYEKLK